MRMALREGCRAHPEQPPLPNWPATCLSFRSRDPAWRSGRPNQRDPYEAWPWLASRPPVRKTISRENQHDQGTVQKMMKPGKCLVASALFLCTLAATAALAQTTGTPWTGDAGIRMTADELAIAQRNADALAAGIVRPPRILPFRKADRANNKDAPGAKDLPPEAPPAPSLVRDTSGPKAAQTLSGINFTGATLADTSAFPPDSMGAVGPDAVHRRGQRPHPQLRQDHRRRRRRAEPRHRHVLRERDDACRSRPTSRPIRASATTGCPAAGSSR